MNNARLEAAIRSCDRVGRSTDSLVCDASKIMYRVVQLQQRLDLVETSISRIEDIPFWSSIHLDGEPCHSPKDRMARLQMEPTLAVLGDDRRSSTNTETSR